MLKTKMRAMLAKPSSGQTSSASDRDNSTTSTNGEDSIAATLAKIRHSLNHKRPPDEHKLKMVNFNAMVAVLPLYIYPGQNAWQPLFDSIAANPSTTFGIVINPNNGPGAGQYPDSEYITNIARLNSYNNTILTGYVYTTWGTRNISDVEADIATYEGWSNYTAQDISVNGIFMDEAPANTSLVPYMAALYNNTKTVMTKGDIVILNPGTPIDASFYQYADVVNAYENTYDDWMHGGNQTIPPALRSKSGVIIHSCNVSSDQLGIDTTNLINAGFHGALISSTSSYQQLSASWPDYVHKINTYYSNSSSAAATWSNNTTSSTSASSTLAYSTSTSSSVTTSSPALASAKSSSINSSSKLSPRPPTTPSAMTSAAKTSSTRTSPPTTTPAPTSTKPPPTSSPLKSNAPSSTARPTAASQSTAKPLATTSTKANVSPAAQIATASSTKPHRRFLERFAM